MLNSRSRVAPCLVRHGLNPLNLYAAQIFVVVQALQDFSFRDVNQKKIFLGFLSSTFFGDEIGNYEHFFCLAVSRKLPILSILHCCSQRRPHSSVQGKSEAFRFPTVSEGTLKILQLSK